MKNFILSLILLSSLSLATNAQGGCGFQILGSQQCCIRVQANFVPNATAYSINWGDGNIQTFQNSPANPIIQYCYSASMNYTVTIIYLNGVSAICGTNQGVAITNCIVGSCVSYLCWEDFIGYFKCANSVTLQTVNGSNLGNSITINFSNSILVPGGYNAIFAELSTILSQYGATISTSGPQQSCNKGGSPLPGFFINGPVKIISINGDDCNGSSSGSALFNHQNCP